MLLLGEFLELLGSTVTNDSQYCDLQPSPLWPMMLLTVIHCLQYCDLQSMHCGVQSCGPSYSPVLAALPYGGIYSHHSHKDL